MLPQGDYFPISKLHSILAVANLLTQNNISQICCYSQISFTVNCSFSDNLIPSRVTFILPSDGWHSVQMR